MSTPQYMKISLIRNMVNKYRMIFACYHEDAGKYKECKFAFKHEMKNLFICQVVKKHKHQDESLIAMVCADHIPRNSFCARCHTPLILKIDKDNPSIVWTISPDTDLGEKEDFPLELGVLANSAKRKPTNTLANP